MGWWRQAFSEQWYLGHSDYCCIRCGKKHRNTMLKREGEKTFYTLDYCSRACFVESVQLPEWKNQAFQREHMEQGLWPARWGARVKIGFTPENRSTPRERLKGYTGAEARKILGL